MSFPDMAKDTVKGKVIADNRRALQRGKALVDGAAAATDIAVAGILADDTIFFVTHFPAAAAPEELTSEASVSSDGNIQISTTDTTGGKLLVEWIPAVATA